MNEDIEIRKLPKKTIVTIFIIIILGIAIFFTLKNLKEEKMIEIISTLGHTNVKNMQVINKLKVEDKKTRYKSTVYKVVFFDENLKKSCIGFIHIGKNNNYSKDFDCK